MCTVVTQLQKTHTVFQFNQEMVLFNWVKQVVNSGNFWIVPYELLLLTVTVFWESSILPGAVQSEFFLISEKG